MKPKRSIKQENKEKTIVEYTIKSILEKLAELISDATEGILTDLNAAAVAGDAYLLEGEHANDDQVREQLGNLQTWLTAAFSQSAGVGGTAQAFTTAINALIAG